jgi:hypothetical protein
MKLSIALSALLITGFVAASTEPASAVVYCQYVAYPVGCVVRPESCCGRGRSREPWLPPASVPLVWEYGLEPQ